MERELMGKNIIIVVNWNLMDIMKMEKEIMEKNIIILEN